MNESNVRKKPNSLAFRVTVLVGVTIFICLSIMNLIVIESIDQHFIEQDADELNEVFNAVQIKLVEAHEQNVLPSSILFQAVSGHHGVYYQVEDKNENTIFTSQDADLFAFPTKFKAQNKVIPSTLIIFNDGKYMLRGTKTNFELPTKLGPEMYTVTVASNMEFHMNYMQKLKRTLWGIVFLAGVITVFAARFAVYRGHSPLRQLSREIESITADKLDIRLDPLNVPIELTTLVDSFNTMLKRLEDGFERLSHFSADIAHELRTPITNLTTQTQVVLSNLRDSEAYIEILYSNLEEYERMTKMVSDMLLLAQAEHGLIKPNKDNVVVNKEIKALFDYFELLADEKKIQLILEGSNVELVCDKTMLRQALSNLISNAIRYSPENDKIIIKTKASSDLITIAIINHGEIIPKEHLTRLFDRFYRADFSRNRDGRGAGLGLTIAKSIVNINGGDIFAESSETNTCFTIIFKKDKISMLSNTGSTKDMR
jgi:two-component system, OmpR family, heavy metal sensor histidine kinase CusS